MVSDWLYTYIAWTKIELCFEQNAKKLSHKSKYVPLSIDMTSGPSQLEFPKNLCTIKGL